MVRRRSVMGNPLIHRIYSKHQAHVNRFRVSVGHLQVHIRRYCLDLLRQTMHSAAELRIPNNIDHLAREVRYGIRTRVF